MAQNGLYQNSFCRIRMYINETSLNEISGYDLSYSIAQKILSFEFVCMIR